MSLRGRILLALLAVVAVGLVASDLVTFQALQTFLHQRVDDQLTALVRPVTARMFFPDGDIRTGGVVPRLEGGGAVYAEVRDSQNHVLAQLHETALGARSPAIPSLGSLPGPLTCGSQPECDGARIIDVHSSGEISGDYRVRISALRTGGRLVIALPLADVQGTLAHLLLIELLVSAAVLGGAALGGLYLVRVGLRPLSEIEHTAATIAAGDLKQRVARAETRTEVGRLGLALNAMLGQIEAAFAEKEASESRLRRFLADASHELRSPLTSIRGYAELFRRGADHRPDDLAKVMQRIEAEGARMGLLVDDLLLLARMDQDPVIQRRPLDLHGIVGDAVEAARVVDRGRDWEYRGAGGLMVDGQPERLRQVVDNLLGNVRTHTPADAPALVTLTRAGGAAVLEVEDRGPGLPAEGREKIFDRFYRVDPSRSRDSGGAGLGLAIVAAIVQAHGGSVSVRDRSGGGSIFRVDLPLSGAIAAD